MSTQRLLLLSHLVLGLLVALVFEHTLQSLSGISALGFLSRSLAGVEGWTWSTLLGFALAIGVGLWVWKNARIHQLATEVVEEMQRVSWPTLAETRAATVAVIIATLVAAAMLGLFDYGWGSLTQKVYGP